MRYFKYVGSGHLASDYDKPRPKRGVIYPENHKISGENAGYYATNVGLYLTLREEWQEVFVYDEEQNITDEHTSRKFKAGVCKMVDGEIEVFVSETIKSFPPDAVTLDTYESGKWYDVRKVLPDESVTGRIFVGMWDEAIRQAVWDDKDERFIGIIGDTLDDVALWRAN